MSVTIQRTVQRVQANRGKVLHRESKTRPRSNWLADALIQQPDGQAGCPTAFAIVGEYDWAGRARVSIQHGNDHGRLTQLRLAWHVKVFSGLLGLGSRFERDVLETDEAQLAVAILYAVCGHKAAELLYDEFRRQIVAQLRGEWRLDAAAVRRWAQERSAG